MTNANETQRAELAALADRLESLRVRGPRFEETVPAENRSEYDAAMARHRAIVAEIDAAEAARRAGLSEQERFLEYACPRDSSDTFLAGLPLLDSLDNG